MTNKPTICSLGAFDPGDAASAAPLDAFPFVADGVLALIDILDLLTMAINQKGYLLLILLRMSG